MKIPIQKYRGMSMFAFFALAFSLSCSEDASLLEEYALSDKDQLLDGFVIDDNYNISSSGTITIDVLANDLINNESNAVITNVSNPRLGTVQINDDNTVTYTLGSTAPQSTLVDVPVTEAYSIAPVAETTPEPITMVEGEPEVTPEPEPTPELEPTPESEPVVEQAPIPEPEPVVEEEPTPEPVSTPAPEPVVEEEPTPEPVSTPAPEPVVEEAPEPIVEEEEVTDTFTYTVETTDEEGNTTEEEGTVTVNVGEGSGCPSGPIIPEYRLNGVWSNGQSDLTVASGTEVMFSMLPNEIGVTVEFPDGTVVGDNYNIGAVTSADSGQYLLASAEGCTKIINLTVEEGEVAPPPPVTETPYLGELKAFPGAEGFGRYATGGRGGRIIEVTNLNDSGSGSLREALEASGARTVIFKVAGYITVQQTLYVQNGNLTIAGQTAPGDGITIRRSSNMDQPAFQITSGNVIVRGIRVRAGRGRNQEFSGDAASIGASDIIFDHCSFSWATDEVIDPYATTRITFQNCIFSEGLMYSSHEYTTNPNSAGYYNHHSMGMLVSNTSSRITIYNSIFAHNSERNPLVNVNPGNVMEMELVNNVYYNWGLFGSIFHGTGYNQVNLINNLHIPGADTKVNRYPILLSNNTTAYTRGNISQYRTNSSESEWNAVGYTLSGNQNMSTSNRRMDAFDFPLRNVSTIDRTSLLNQVLNNAGAFTQDQVTQRVTQDIRNNTGRLINDPSQVGGYPNLYGGTGYTDSDKDGISDAWETAQGLDPYGSADGNADRNGDGYSNLEEFLHSLTL